MSQAPFSQEDISEGEDIDWTNEQEQWNTYKLADGTIMKVKLVLKGVKRLKKHLPDGTPIYMIMSDNVVRVINVPENLKLKTKQSGMKPV